MRQLSFNPDLFQHNEPFSTKLTSGTYRDKLSALLESDLDFHGQSSQYLSHNFHSFPAKFPPQLPRVFIENLTKPDEIVLDPMMGSGTTILEAFVTGRRVLGFDIDPLAQLLCKVKVTPLPLEEVVETGQSVLAQATQCVEKTPHVLQERLESRFTPRTREFVNYWFALETQLELEALLGEIEQISDIHIQDFFRLTFSAIIITKSGGVSLARDLAHTRPHKVADKKPRSALVEFKKRFQKNYKSLVQLNAASLNPTQVDLRYGNAQELPLAEETVDLIVTSPPYAANAIDYMRAHKFSLVWFGYDIETLGEKRRSYIGGEATSRILLEELPPATKNVVQEVSERDAKKGRVLHRYYSEMTRTLAEMLRVLKPGRGAVVVVGTSSMRGIDTRTQDCLADIGESLGFDVVGIGVRRLDRDKRMMPARRKKSASQIEQRMHEEYVLGFYKPLS